MLGTTLIFSIHLVSAEHKHDLITPMHKFPLVHYRVLTICTGFLEGLQSLFPAAVVGVSCLNSGKH